EAASPIIVQNISDDIAQVRPQQIALETKIATAELEHHDKSTALAEAQEELSEFQKARGVDLATTPLEEVTAKLRHDALHTPIRGSVDQFIKAKGASVNAGQTVIRVVSEPTFITVGVSKKRFDSVSVGDTVWVASADSPMPRLPVKVTHREPVDRASDSLFNRGKSKIRLHYPEESAWPSGKSVKVYFEDPNLSVKEKINRKLGR
ncbi:MAG: hypothetical protein AAF226_03395, partial [Verrucomicrobiota bacterium]